VKSGQVRPGLGHHDIERALAPPLEQPHPVHAPEHAADLHLTVAGWMSDLGFTASVQIQARGTKESGASGFTLSGGAFGVEIGLGGAVVDGFILGGRVLGSVASSPRMGPASAWSRAWAGRAGSASSGQSGGCSRCTGRT
jgi:hypothetical protein